MLLVLKNQSRLSASVRQLYNVLGYDTNFYAWVNHRTVEAVKGRDYHKPDSASLANRACNTGDDCLRLPLASTICRRMQCMDEPSERKSPAEYSHAYITAKPTTKAPASPILTLTSMLPTAPTYQPHATAPATSLVGKDLHLITHEGQACISARPLYDALKVKNNAGFPGWFKHFTKRYELGADYFEVKPFSYSGDGRVISRSGLYFFKLETALDIARRAYKSDQQTAAIAALKWLGTGGVHCLDQEARDETIVVPVATEPEIITAPESELLSAPAPTQEPTPSPVMMPTAADNILNLAVVIQELKAQEITLIMEQQHATALLTQIREKLSDARANLIIAIG